MENLSIFLMTISGLEPQVLIFLLAMAAICLAAFCIYVVDRSRGNKE